MATAKQYPDAALESDPRLRVIHAMIRHVQPKLAQIIGELAGAGDVEALQVLTDIGPGKAPKNYDAAKKVFMPVLRNFKLTQNNAVELLRQWAGVFGFTEEEHFTRLLAEVSLLASTDIVPDIKSLLALGANPNADCSLTDSEPLTILGRAIAENANHRMPGLISCMLENVLARGEVPYYRRSLGGKPQTIFDAVMESSPPQTVIIGVIETIQDLHAAGRLAEEVQLAIGAAFLRKRAPEKEPSRSEEEWQRCRLRMLSFARFSSPEDWSRALYNPNDERGLARLLVLGSFEAQGVRTINAMARDGVVLDDIPTEITDHAVPCTLLQAAAYLGRGELVTALLESGADANRTVGREAEGFPIANLDAEGLWKLGNDNKPSHVISTWKARTAIDSVIKKVRAGA